MIKSVMVDGAEALKMMVDGKLAWERSVLPKGFVSCVYLESTGTQYINTDIIVDPSMDESRIDYMSLKEYGEPFQVPLGSATLDAAGNINRGWYFYVGMRLNFAFLNGGIPATVSDYIIDYGRRVSVILSGEFASVDSTIFNSPSNNMNSDNPITIFKRNVKVDKIDSEAYAHGRLFSFSHLRNGEVVMNLVPCLDSAGVPCMYDTVTKQPFYNKGTGEFLYELA